MEESLSEKNANFSMRSIVIGAIVIAGNISKDLFLFYVRIIISDIEYLSVAYSIS